MFVTTGILVRFLHADRNLTGVTHIFLDEVHERTIETDVCMILLKDLLKRYGPSTRCIIASLSLLFRRSELKLVLMSATVQAADLTKYFSDLFDRNDEHALRTQSSMNISAMRAC